MTPTIDDIEAALPHVPAGLHCGDLTEADERREFAVTVHEIVVRASQTTPGSPESDETDTSAQSPQNDPETLYGQNNGVSSWAQGGIVPPGGLYFINEGPLVEWGVDEARVNWGPPDPGSRCYQHCTHWTEAGEECCDCKRIIPEHELFMPWCPGKQENAR